MTSSNSSGPLYARIAAVLRDQIQSGELQPGDRLPSEQQLRDRYNVSRNTVRLALHALIHEELISAARGSGYYVSDHPKPRRTHEPPKHRDDIAEVLDRLDDILDEVHALRDRVEAIAASRSRSGARTPSRQRE
jgi:DNA-binding GntR family transcriptional regulator